MLTASAEYQEYEALAIGASPVVLASFLPFIWPNGVTEDSDYFFCAIDESDAARILIEYGWVGAFWESAIQEVSMQIGSSPAVITWTYNSPGYDSYVYYRAAADAATLLDTSWTLIESGDTIDIYPAYQLTWITEGYPCWTAEETEDQVDDYTAYAQDTAGVDGYAADEQVYGDPLAYIEDITITGEFTVLSDIEEAGSLTVEAPKEFDEIVAGDYSGLLLNNRQGSFDESLNWTPAPVYSPNKSTFFLGDQDWYDINLKIEMGWNTGGFLEAPFVESPLFKGEYTDLITLFQGKVKKWGPITRAVDADGMFQPHTVEVYAQDFIIDSLQKRIALPNADGTPNPKTYGEFLCKAEPVIAWNPNPPIQTAYFEDNNYYELTNILESGGGAVSLITPGLTGDRAFRATVTGANQTAAGVIKIPVAGELFATGTMRFTTVPESPANLNMTFMQIMDTGGSADFAIKVYNTSDIYSLQGGQSKFNIQAYIGVPLKFGIWVTPGTPGHWRFWINGEEILTHDDTTLSTIPSEIQFGAITGGTTESWTIDFDDIQVWDNYFKDAFIVNGGPFADIGSVYIDNIAQPESKTVGAYTQTLTRYPEYGMVHFESDDPEFEIDGDVIVRVIENAGGRHALEIITLLLAEAGLTDYIDATALVAAYVTCPDDYIHARFEGGGDREQGLKDYASLGITVADALKEITSRCLYWIFSDAGVIKIIPYTGTPPASPVLNFTSANLRETTQTFDLESQVPYVASTYGWYDRNPALFYVAGDTSASGEGVGRDYTWNNPVACESYDVVKAKTDLLLKFLSVQERLEPVRLSLSGARLEMLDVVSVTDEIINDAAANYWVMRKDVGFDQGSRETTLQLMRFLGET